MDETILGIPPLRSEMLHDTKRLRNLYDDMRHNYYWSEDFSAEFYITQAQAGFIAVTDRYESKELLLPELQFSYAVLHFEKLHISKKVRRILKRDAPTLHMTRDFSKIVEAIRAYHSRCWITPRYERTLRSANRLDENFEAVGFYIKRNGRLIAGEIGYIVGNTYTSLSGFSSKEKAYRNYGTVQMVLTARFLQVHGFAFWNLGQPYMQYKFDLGATLYDRKAFLTLWHRHIRNECVCVDHPHLFTLRKPIV